MIASDVVQVWRILSQPSPTRPGKIKPERGGGKQQGRILSLTSTLTREAKVEVVNLDLIRGNSDLPPLVDLLPQASAFGFKLTPASKNVLVETSRPSCFIKAYLFVHYFVPSVFSKSHCLNSHIRGFIFLSPAFARYFKPLPRSFYLFGDCGSKLNITPLLCGHLCLIYIPPGINSS